MQKETIPLPKKLDDDLRKSRPGHVQAFRSVLAWTMEHCPATIIDSKQRYSALYKRGDPFVYIEPQTGYILFGCFKDYVDRLEPAVKIPHLSFPSWNTSKGGLVGFGLPGYTPDIELAKTELQRLISESYRWT